VYDRFWQQIQYTVASHSCTKCGLSQKVCATGKQHGVPYQWPHVLVPVVRAVMGSGDGVALVRQIGYLGAERDWSAYGRWLGQRYPRRFWGDWVSNAMVVLIKSILYGTGVSR
jgi:hypothetical protein